MRELRCYGLDPRHAAERALIALDADQPPVQPLVAESFDEPVGEADVRAERCAGNCADPASECAHGGTAERADDHVHERLAQCVEEERRGRTLRRPLPVILEVIELDAACVLGHQLLTT
jgi:hypothetical protein